VRSPRASVCVPTCDAGPFVEATVRAVQAQTLEDWELVLVDDASRDGTGDRLEALVRSLGDDRMRLHRGDRRLGMAGNWNRAVAFAGGRFVKLLCQDDLLAPECLATQVEALERHQTAVLASCARVIMNARAERLFTRGAFSTGLHPGHRVIRRCLWTGTNLIGEPSACLWRRTALEAGPPFAEAIRYYTDLDLWLRLLVHGDLHFTREALVAFRVHGRSATRQLEGEMVRDWFRMAERVATRRGTPLGSPQMAWMSVAVRAQNTLRRAVYRRAGRAAG
jgi:glycosyltransferase involved in cell wall biosynthesis